MQTYKVPHRTGHININIARRLTAAYGDQASHVTDIAQHERLSRRLVPWHDIIEAEVCTESSPGNNDHLVIFFPKAVVNEVDFESYEYSACTIAAACLRSSWRKEFQYT